MTTKAEALDALEKIIDVGLVGMGEYLSVEAEIQMVRNFINSVPEWQPIEEWKPDGAKAHWPYLRALVFSDGEVFEADWKPEGNPPQTGEWWPSNLDDEYSNRIYPTHWMLLPNPPITGETK